MRKELPKGSRIACWGLIVLGALACLAALWSFTSGQPGLPPFPGAAPAGDPDLQAIAGILDAIARMLESFARLSVSVQWTLPGLGSLALGSDLLSNRPY